MTVSDRSTTAALLAGGIVVVAAAVIVIFGFVPIPEYPTLGEEPAPQLSGKIAYAVDEELDDRFSEFVPRCVHVIELPEGQADEIVCAEGIGWGMAWTDDGWIVAESFGRFNEFHGEFSSDLALIDPSTGGVSESVGYEGEPRFLRSEQRQIREDGARVRTEDSGTTVVVVLADGSTIDLVGAGVTPSNYRYSEAQWSPDGEYVLVVDTEGRIIILSASEDPRPRVVAETGHEYGITLAWFMPGNATYTVDREKLQTGR